MRALLASVLLGCLAAPLGPAAPAAADIYKWTDANGRLHFAQDLSQVPREHRAQAQESANRPEAPTPRVQTYSGAASPAPRATRARPPATGSPDDKRTYRIPVQQAGSMLVVNVRLNDRVVAPFFIDTGASDVAVPRAVIEQLGIDLSKARTGRYGTANGIIEVPLITLDSVELGGARVDGVPASVSDQMEMGLLGLSFFNHFQYNVDPARGVVTLVENDLDEQGVIRGGRSEVQWRAEFAQLHERMRKVDYEQSTTPSSHGREHERLEAVQAELARQLEVLEDEADDARVPFSWRD